MRTLIFLIFIFTFNVGSAQTQSNNVITTDIENFWNAYDQIKSTKDSVKKYEIVNSVFISRGTPGLKALMTARSYTDKPSLIIQ